MSLDKLLGPLADDSNVLFPIYQAIWKQDLNAYIGEFTPKDDWLVQVPFPVLDDLNAGSVKFLKSTFPPLLHLRTFSRSFIIRAEYDAFFDHMMTRLQKLGAAHFYVTGQPGIGKSWACTYLLFRLLSRGESVFFVPTPKKYYHFGEDGVRFRSKPPPGEESPVIELVKKSFVLLDVDGTSFKDYACPDLFQAARCVVWTSSLRESRLRGFEKAFAPSTWYMKTWSSKEIAALSTMEKMQKQDILHGLRHVGPIPRRISAFLHNPEQIGRVNEQAIQGLINFNPHRFTDGFADTDAEQVIHRLLMINPVVTVDSAGQYSTDRRRYTAQFRSSTIQRDIVDVMQQKPLRLQKQYLAALLDTTETRALAGNLTEELIHT